MIDFACKQFDLEEIIKCGFGLTKAEIELFFYFIKNNREFCSTNKISRKTKFNLTTIQKAVKKMHEKKILFRQQKNLSNGGYVFEYKIKSKKEIREILKEIVRKWSKSIEREIDGW